MRLSERELARVLRPRRSGHAAPSGGAEASADCFAEDGASRVFAVVCPLRVRPKGRPRVFVSERALHDRLLGTGAGAPMSPGAVFDAMRGAMRALTPRATRDAERGVRAFLAQEMLRQRIPVFRRPVLVALRMAIPGPPGAAATSRKVGDLDNLEKTVLDAMNGVVIADDSLVVCKFAQKVHDSEPGLRVLVADATRFAAGERAFDAVWGALLGLSARLPAAVSD